MKRRVDPEKNQADEREKLIGLGKRSISKSYYPELKKRLDQLEHFRSLLDHVSDAIFVVDADSGTILDISGSGPTMLGCDAATLKGRPFNEILPPHIARYTANLFQNKNDSINLETELCCPTCETSASVPVDMSIRIIDGHGKRQAVVIARDISERKHNEEALRASHDKLEIRVRERTRELDRANRAKSEFLSIVSHELRTPLTSVLGFAKISRKKLLNTIYPAVDPGKDTKITKEMDRVRKNLDIIVSEGDRLTALINDVLDLAKLEANRVEYRMQPISPQDFLNRSMDAAAGLFKQSSLNLLADIAPDLPIILGDEDRLIQVMINLFSNAVKFTDKGSVTCKASRLDNHIRISVTDTGIGISEKHCATIFDKFTQGEETLADRPKGTGLGLPICRHIIEGHHGHIWVESTPGHGSKFVFTLPVHN
ncbi:PAS domain-containing sensor histidine kinase [uncultured Pseudodesulfovibrio sp.]|uniref:PAS domain-containing sensor histidine kinase n=1 Tax=uncultured Pseudodesulfovibrio sp. TaxID=2035858 RepID=UPI0029C759C9|nr:PAS domain-containing sensor histidine kinase [uncultured Pseudodesulfovibrio sp.]